MKRQQFLQELDAMLELSAGTLQGPERLEDFLLWDSMAMISFIALADSNNNVRLVPRELGSCETVHDLLRIARVES
jgi:acyl carrier protein